MFGIAKLSKCASNVHKKYTIAKLKSTSMAFSGKEKRSWSKNYTLHNTCLRQYHGNKINLKQLTIISEADKTCEARM